MKTPEEILHFWFEELEPADWWKKSETVDAEIRTRFLTTYEAAARGECVSWRKTVQGRLAEVIVLDQFPRNMFRGTAKAFETDVLALMLAQEALPFRKELSTVEKGFLLMPFMHSESLGIHEMAESLFQEPGLEKRAKYEQKHREIIAQFGRYPHRNIALGRSSTPEELEFIKNNPDF